MLHFFIIAALLLIVGALAAITIGDHFKDKRPLLTLALLLSCLGASAQLDTISFDYHIRTSGHDKLVRRPAFVVLDTNAIFIAVSGSQQWRQVVDQVELSGESVYYFANGDGIRLTKNLLGEIDGAFVSSRGRSWFLGKCKETAERAGWINK